MADAAYSSTRSRRQRDLSNIPGFNHSRRSWTGNGMRMTMETATYASPGFSFRSNTNDGTNIFSDFMQPTRNSSSRGGASGGLLGGGLLGGAINLLNNVANPQSRQPRPRTTPERRSYMVESDEVDSDVTSSDEDLAYGSLPRARIAQPKSVLGRVKDRILEHGRQHHEEAPPSRPRETRSDRRRARPPSPEAPRARTRRRSSIFNYERTPESSPERRTHAPPPQTKSSHGSHAEREVAILQRAVEDERKEYLGAKQRFQHASQRSVIDAEHIQDLLNQVKVHGARLASAQRKLQLAKEQRQQRDTATRATRQRTQRRPSPPRAAYYESDEDEEHFESEFRRSFTAFGSIPRSNVPFDEPIRHTGVFDPLFGFRVFDRLFSEADASFSVHGNASGFHFSTASGNDGPTFKRTNFASTSTPHGANRPRPGPRPQQYTTTQQPTPQLPRNPLRATEAARLFARYDSTWNALSATLPTIPYPTRTLLAAAITDASTIPHQLAHTWSTEQIMQANTALFFVLALGLAPVICDAGVVTFNRLATPEGDLKGLISVLKKEKMRWHSDRLGRRNEGAADGGVNTALQRDERARAVFHGVCALMEFALGRTG